MRRAVAGLVLTASLLVGGAGPAQAARHRDRCRYEDCGDRYGDGSGGGQGASGGDYGHGKNGDQGDSGRDQCHSFCNNTIIVPPAPGQGQQPKSVGCAVPVPWHCDPRPSGFIPPNPAKIPQQIADFIKLVGDFVQSVIKFAV